MRHAKLQRRIATLIFDILRDPFQGLGKPEPLKHNLKGCWSRRISDEHRLVYQVSDQAVHILSCKYHYDCCARPACQGRGCRAEPVTFTGDVRLLRAPDTSEPAQFFRLLRK